MATTSKPAPARAPDAGTRFDSQASPLLRGRSMPGQVRRSDLGREPGIGFAGKPASRVPAPSEPLARMLLRTSARFRLNTRDTVACRSLRSQARVGPYG